MKIGFGNYTYFDPNANDKKTYNSKMQLLVCVALHQKTRRLPCFFDASRI